jgi:hypothetical protein
MRIPITPDSSIERHEVVTMQHHIEDDLENRTQASVMSDDLPNEHSKLVPLSTPIPWCEIAGTSGAGQRYRVHVIDLADVDSKLNLEATLGCRVDSERDDAGDPSSPQEAVPELLDFSIDIEQMLGNGDSVQQDRPRGKVLKFELPAHMKAMPPASLVNSGKPARVIEFRRPEGERAFRGSKFS